MSLFQKRHYEALAIVCQNVRADLTDSAAYRFECELCRMFSADNPAFDEDRFKRACVPGANVRKRKP